MLQAKKKGGGTLKSIFPHRNLNSSHFKRLTKKPENDLTHNTKQMSWSKEIAELFVMILRALSHSMVGSHFISRYS